MKSIFLLIAALFVAGFVSAQIIEGTVTMNKVVRPAIAGEFNFTSEVTEAVILEDLRTRGFGKGDSQKDFKMYAGIAFPMFSTEKIDLYVKVAPKSKSEKGKSLVYLVISKGYDNFISGATDQATMDSAKIYLGSLMGKFEQEKLRLDIDAQQELIAKVQKKYDALVGTGESLQTKKQDIEKEIEKNLTEQNNQKAELDKEKQILDALKAQLR